MCDEQNKKKRNPLLRSANSATLNDFPINDNEELIVHQVRTASGTAVRTQILCYLDISNW